VFIGHYGALQPRNAAAKAAVLTIVKLPAGYTESRNILWKIVSY
jgi:hypothetical protein